ncbi:MAG TPA: hypothetical protein VHV74_24405 [Pseudonocardiaceae bacterium]|jgi:hypothetical protein|nr:hypothetical protein [Pseudonocardiaceae bacterium]
MRRFNDPDDRNRPPEDLTAWLAAGMRRVEAQAWRRWNFTLEDAKRWRAAGVSEALTAAQWHIAGVHPETVGDWFDARITVGEAIRWHEFGFDLDQAKAHMKNGRGPENAYQFNQVRANPAGSVTSLAGSQMQSFLAAGVPHVVMGTYLLLQWTDADAIAWAKEGVKAWDAKAWREIGLTPAEAGELTKKDVQPVDVMRDFWRAGIPYDEVAEWLGAGLTAEEAATQRGSGVTVEQAAALRALRRGGSL